MNIIETVFVDKGMHVNLPEVLHQKGWKKGIIKPYNSSSNDFLVYENNTTSVNAAYDYLESITMK